MLEKYEYIVGLEIHIKLNSENKLFCKCKNIQDFENLTPNTNICPVCSGQPGALPVMNKEPFQKALFLGGALNCDISEYSYFDRKSYFYPDLPLGFQISQFNIPLNGEGYINFFVDNYNQEKRIRVERAHLENDAGKTVHEGDRGFLDFNRAGTPLIEIVTHPDFYSAEEVTEFIKELQRRVRFNNIGDANLEKGQLRCDVNISVREKGSEELGGKVELKNINSFGAINRAIEAEFQRQAEILENGGSIDQETRGWNDEKRETYLMRSKEEAFDYRYFPEPDLPLIKVDDKMLSEVKEQLAEHSYLKIKRYKEEYGFNKEYINALIQDVEINSLFEDAVSYGISPQTAAKYIISSVIRVLNDRNISLSQAYFTREQFFEYLNLLETGELMENHGKQVLFEMFDTGKNPKDIIEEKGLKPIDTSEISGIVDEVLAQNPEAVEDIKNGENKAIGFLVGNVMKKSGGKADPKQVNQMINDKIFNQ